MYSQQQLLAGSTAGVRIPDKLPQVRAVIDPAHNVTTDTRAILYNTSGGTNNKQCLIASSGNIAAGTAGSPDFSANQTANGNMATAGQFGIEIWRNVNSQVTGSSGTYYSNDRLNGGSQTNGRPKALAIRCANGSQYSNYSPSSFTATLSSGTLTVTGSTPFSAGSVGNGITDGAGNWVIITASLYLNVVTVVTQTRHADLDRRYLTMYKAGGTNLLFYVWAATSAAQSSGGAAYQGNTFSAPTFWSKAYCSFDLPNAKIYVYFDGITTPEIITLNGGTAIYLLVSQSPVPCIGGWDQGTSSPAYAAFEDGVIGPIRLYAGRPDDGTLGIGTAFITYIWNNGWPRTYFQESFYINAEQSVLTTKAFALVASWSCTTGDPIADDTGNNGNMVTALGSGGSGTVGTIPLVEQVVDRAKGIIFAPLTYGYAYRWIANGLGTGKPSFRSGANSGMEATIPSSWLTDVAGDLFAAFSASSFVASTDANFVFTICNNSTYTSGHDPQYFILMAEYESGAGGPSHNTTGEYVTTQLRGYISGANQSMQASGTTAITTSTVTIANVKALGTGYGTTTDGNGNYTASDWEFAVSTSGNRGVKDPISSTWPASGAYGSIGTAKQNVWLASMTNLSRVCIGHLNYNDGTTMRSGVLNSGSSTLDLSQAFWTGDIGIICLYGSPTPGNVSTGQAALPGTRNQQVQNYLCNYYGM